MNLMHYSSTAWCLTSGNANDHPIGPFSSKQLAQAWLDCHVDLRAYRIESISTPKIEANDDVDTLDSDFRFEASHLKLLVRGGITVRVGPQKDSIRFTALIEWPDSRPSHTLHEATFEGLVDQVCRRVIRTIPDTDVAYILWSMARRKK